MIKTKLEEAKELQRRLGKALWELGGLSGASDFNDCEVRLRSEAIAGILLIASSEIRTLIKEWEGES